MSDDEWQDIIETMRANVRKHAGYFAWRTDRELEEYGVVQAFHESLVASSEAFFDQFESRGKGNDPPDCQGIDSNGNLVGIEVTELVDGNAIKAAEAGQNANFWPPFEESYLLELVASRITRKDSPTDLKGGPYSQYLLVIYCDEPRVLDYDLITAVREKAFPRPRLIDRAFLLLSYDPGSQRCPYIEIAWAAA